MDLRRVVVTGLEAVTPLGGSVSAFWDGLISGRSGIRTISHFDASPFDVRFGGDCFDFKASEHLENRQIKRMDRFAQLAYVAARQAFKDAGLPHAGFVPHRAGVIIGTGI